MKEEMLKIIDEGLKRDGLKMVKPISKGIFGVVYDLRTAVSLERLYELNREGFKVDENVGLFLLNCFTRE